MKTLLLSFAFMAATVFFGLAAEAKSPVAIAISVIAMAAIVVFNLLPKGHERTA
jgi:hypothetical protein